MDETLGDRCTAEIETGMCRGYILQYGYVPEQNNCVKFIYGACGGNSNRFDSYNMCMKACASP